MKQAQLLGSIASTAHLNFDEDYANLVEESELLL